MLQQRAASKAAWQSAARRAALEWLRSPATEAAAKAVADWQNGSSGKYQSPQDLRPASFSSLGFQ